MSECILLRKYNDDLKCLIGQSFNEKNKFEAEKILNEIHSKAENRTINKKALCYVTKNGLIRSVGGSTLMMDKNGKIFSNLILDGFGEFLTAIFSKVNSAFKSFNSPDSLGVSENFGAYGSSSTFNLRTGSGTGVQLQVGSGITAPARTDFNVQTAFGTAPEDNRVDVTTDSVWNSGLGNFKQNMAIIAGGSGTINESVMFARWSNSGVVLKILALFRDIISPAQAFIVGQTIALEYTVQL